MTPNPIVPTTIKYDKLQTSIAKKSPYMSHQVYSLYISRKNIQGIVHSETLCMIRYPNFPFGAINIQVTLPQYTLQNLGVWRDTYL